MFPAASRFVPFVAVAAVAAGMALASPAALAQSAPAATNVNSESVELASTSGATLKLTIDSMCRQGKIVFRMRNDGQSWPGIATLQVVDAKTGAVVTGRTMKLKEKQVAGFSIRPEDAGETLSIRIQANWLSEPYEHAVGQSCP